MTATNQTPTYWNFADANPAPANSRNRMKEVKFGRTFAGTIAGFVGVEYFFAPHLSFGGEFNLGLTFASRGEDRTTSESWDTTDNKVKTKTSRNNSWTESFGGNRYLVDAGETKLFTKTSGHISLNFHF